MATSRIVRIVVGLALIGYGLYSGIAWFYLGIIPLIMGFINWCPLEMKMGSCNPESGCCASNNKEKTDSACCSSENSNCCSSESEEKSESACCTPKTDATTASATNIASFKAVQPSQNGTTLIEILGTGCSKCIALEKVVNEAIKSLDGEYEVKKVSDIEEIMTYNVVSTPGLVVNGTVVSTGKLLSVEEVKKILQV